jgi:lipopolysaccharide/colanic/teichoic acid biosynthesis glycosyltransferase
MFDIVFATALLIVLAPVLLGLMIAVKLDSRGPVFYRCRRAGLRGREFAMLKLRKMYDGARGPVLTAADDRRFTRVGRFLARTKLDEIPQLWNVLKGEMSVVGPRPEDPTFVERRRREFEPVLSVRPGITGLSQLAFAQEPDILDPENRETDYERRILPQKLHIDRLYAERRSIGKDVEILYWTAAAVLFRKAVAVHRSDGKLTRRRRPAAAGAHVGGSVTSEAT